MKLFAMGFVLIYSHVALSYMDENVRPNLKFDKNSREIASFINTEHLQVKLEELSNFPNGRQKERLLQAMTVMEDVLNSEQFKEKVIGYLNSNGERLYSGNEGLSNEEVYKRIMLGKELVLADTMGVANLNIHKYKRRFSRVIAWTDPKVSKWIRVNWRFYSWYPVENMVSNLVHEWIHLIGFFHTDSKDSESVPYAVGEIAGQVAAELYPSLN